MRKLLALITLALLTGASSASAAEGPSLETSTAKLDAAVRCPKTFRAGGSEPVLLLHGTFADAQANWSWNYQPQLTSLGFDVCTVDFPNRSLDDIQVAAEYAVHAIRVMAARSGEKIDVITSSQGGMQGRWAVKWWPDVREAVDDLVLLASPNHGTDVGVLAATFGRCFASCWQMATGSDFITALNAGDETPGAIDYTSLFTIFDELVVPQFPTSTSVLEGATNISLQDVCPGRPSEHAAIATSDAVAYALAFDALTHDGPASVERFEVTTCAQALMPGADPTTIEGGEAGFGGFDDYVTEEPPLKPYARGASLAAADGEPRRIEIAVGGRGGSSPILPMTGGPILPLIAIGTTLIALGVRLLDERRRRL